MAIWHMRIAYWIPKATNTHLGHVTITAFPLLQLLYERISVLHYSTLPVTLDVNTVLSSQCTKYVICPKNKCTDFLFKFLLDSPEITSYLLQSRTLGKLHSGSNVFSTDHSSTGSHFP